MIQNYRGKAPNSHVHTHTGREARRGPRAVIPDPDLPGEGSKGRTSVEEPEGAPWPGEGSQERDGGLQQRAGPD